MEDLLERLDRAVEMFEQLRPDVIVVNTLHSTYLVDPVGGPTDELPPAPISEDSEFLTIDEFLGIYLPGQRRIKVFRQNVRRAASMLRCSERDLEYVVNYHERAHSVVHLGTAREDRTHAFLDRLHKKKRLRELTRLFERIEPFLGEHLAQLATYHAIQHLTNSRNEKVQAAAARMTDVFMALMRHQPVAYRVEAYLNRPISRVTTSIRLIKQGWLAPLTEPWKELMNCD